VSLRPLLLALAALAVTVPAASPSQPALAVHVQGNQLVDGSGATIRLLGVNRSGAEYACIQGWGFWDGPVDDASIAAMASWHINAVRIPLNEDCWLAINGAPAAYSGSAYRSQIHGYVTRLHAHGLYAILDLHWNAPGTAQATGQQRMPDADHAPAFWRSVARSFKGDPGVVFDLYNEPHDVSWSCWRSGCTVPEGWKAAGMQKLVNAVRKVGATQPVMLGGLGWAGDLSGWLANRPSDPLGQEVASFHTYNFGGCVTPSCWNATAGQVAAQDPVVTGEVGENDCAHGYLDQYLPWADAHGVSYLGWTWDTWDCSSGPALISDYSGTPTAFGVGLRDHLAGLR
jgi:uncharacterized protein YbdZ (MbtH family)